MTVGDLKVYLLKYPEDSQVYVCCEDESMHIIADAEPVCSKSNSFGIMLNLSNEIY